MLPHDWSSTGILRSTLLAWRPTLQPIAGAFSITYRMIQHSSMIPASTLLPMSADHHRSLVVAFIKLQSSSSQGQFAQCQCGWAEFPGSLPALEQFCRASFLPLTPARFLCAGQIRTPHSSHHKYFKHHVPQPY